MKDKIIIHNYTDLPHYIVLNKVNAVIQNGKISETKHGKQYCFVTMFNDNYTVTCTRFRNTYTFKVYKED